MHPRDFNGSCTTRFIVESLEILRSFLRFPRQIDGEIFFAAFGDELTDTLGTTLTCNFVLQTDDDASLIDGERDSERCGIDESAFFFFLRFYIYRLMREFSRWNESVNPLRTNIFSGIYSKY